MPEAYRQKFRGYRKSEGQSYMEFMKEKEGLLEKWCESKNVGEEIRTLKQLILMEEFLHCVPDHLRIYLNERKIESSYCMAEIADEYAITHKKGKIGCDLLGHAKTRLRSNPTNEMREKDNRYAYRERPNVQRENRPMICYRCGKPGHLTFQCQTGRRPEINKNPTSKPQGAIAGNPVEKRYCAFTIRGVVYCRNRKGYKINIL